MAYKDIYIFILLIGLSCSEKKEIKEEIFLMKTNLEDRVMEKANTNTYGEINEGRINGDVNWVHMDFEDAYRFSKTAEEYAFLYDNGKEFILFQESNGKIPWNTAGEHRVGTHSLGTQIFLDEDNQKERSEIITSIGDESYALRFGRLRYWGQSFLVQRDTDDDTDPVVIMQIVQHGYPTFLPVPFVIWLKMENGMVQLRAVCSDAAGTKHPLFSSSWLTIGSKDEWIDIAVKAAPRVDGHLGDIQVKVNGILLGSKRLYWGYCSGSDYWRLSSGIYRPEPDNTDNIVIMLDEIKLGSSWEIISP